MGQSVDIRNKQTENFNQSGIDQIDGSNQARVLQNLNVLIQSGDLKVSFMNKFMIIKYFKQTHLVLI